MWSESILGDGRSSVVFTSILMLPGFGAGLADTGQKIEV